MLIQFSYAQQKELNYEDIDNTTLHLFNQKNWKDLKVYGEAAIKQNYNFYYLNLRTGIACYYLQEFYDAIHHLNNSIRNNYQSSIAREYLYLSYIGLGMEEEALHCLQQLPSDKQTSFNVKKSKYLDFIYTEGAVKFSDKRDSVGNTNYFNLGIRHRLSYRLNFYHAFSFLSQDNYWGGYNQYQYYISPKYTLSEHVTLQPAYHYIVTNTNIRLNTNLFNRITSTYTVPPFNQQVFDTTDYFTLQNSAGTVKIISNLYYLGLNYKFNRFDLFPHASVLTVKKTDNLNINQHTDWKYVSVIPPLPPVFSNGGYDSNYRAVKDTSYNQYQFGLEFSYTLPFFSDRIKIGADVNYVSHNSDNLWAWSPNITARIGKKLWINTEYYHGNIYNLAEKRGSIVNNSIDITKSRLSILGYYAIKKNLGIYLMYQNESKKEATYKSKYQFNTLLLGLKLNL
jgi:hypothetical protein